MAGKDFVHDTDPICRVVVAARTLVPEAPLLDVLRDLRCALYIDGLDTTDPMTLARVTALALIGFTNFRCHRRDAAEMPIARDDQEARDDIRQAPAWGSTAGTADGAEGSYGPATTPGYACAGEVMAHIKALRESLGATSLGH